MRKLTALGVASLMLTTGCAGVGVRPRLPDPRVTACAEYLAEVAYARDLETAYRARATQNRGWIYAAGAAIIAGLAVVSGGAALGALTLPAIAAAGTASGAVASGFALADNRALALAYTESANQIARAGVEADAELLPNREGHRYRNQPACAVALNRLRGATTEARVLLETLRTDSAAAAAYGAVMQRDRLDRTLGRGR